ncbi:MAG: cob(I)yrinic acid a,c-diamide adenosyltransferase [Bacteroidales bacterium]
MKIYTKKGDQGTTSLVGGARVPKTHPRVMAYGDVDELISIIGIIRSKMDEETAAKLRRIQENLMWGSAHLAAEPDNSKKLKNLDPNEVNFLEEEIDKMYSEMPSQKSFILPAGPYEASLCHLARTICRRAERSALLIGDINEEIALVLKYLNRLSDYFFALGRYQCHINKIDEDFWLP